MFLKEFIVIKLKSRSSGQVYRDKNFKTDKAFLHYKEKLKKLRIFFSINKNVYLRRGLQINKYLEC